MSDPGTRTKRIKPEAVPLLQRLEDRDHELRMSVGQLTRERALILDELRRLRSGAPEAESKARLRFHGIRL